MYSCAWCCSYSRRGPHRQFSVTAVVRERRFSKSTTETNDKTFLRIRICFRLWAGRRHLLFLSDVIFLDPAKELRSPTSSGHFCTWPIGSSWHFGLLANGVKSNAQYTLFKMIRRNKNTKNTKNQNRLK